MDKPKLTRKDLKIIDAKISVKAIEVDGKIINLTPLKYAHVDTYITHEVCECGEEFEKKFTYDKLCPKCALKRNNERYSKLKLIEWDGKTPLSLFDDDEYFFNEESVVEYCKENELELSDLKLILCSKTNFKEIELEQIIEYGELVHEDWEPSKEFSEKLKEFNDWLVSQNTNTWAPTNFRVTLTL